MIRSIVAIAWVYVVLLMALTEPSITAGIMTFLFYCIFPLMILLYLMRTPQRKRELARSEAAPQHLPSTGNSETQHQPNNVDLTEDGQSRSNAPSGQ